MSLGTAVIDERVYRITHIELKQSAIHFTAYLRTVERVTLEPGMQVRIHAPDRTLVAVFSLSLPDGPVTAEGDPAKGPASLTVFLPLGFVEFVGKSAWPGVRT